MTKTYQVVLTKSFLVTLQAENEQEARRIAELYTSDISDISLNEHREQENFSIESIECMQNDSISVEQI